MLKKNVLTGLLIVASFSLISCAGLLQGTLTPGQAAGAGAVSTAAAEKIKTDLKELSTVKPVIHIKPLEVCFKTGPLGPDKLQCILSPCKTDCTRIIDISSVNQDKTVFIPEDLWLEFAGEIKAACTSPLEEYKELCTFHYTKYSDISKVLIFGGE